MTEQQFEKLKQLLDASDAPQNSEALDQTILSAAHQHAAQTKKQQHKQQKQQLAHRRFMSWLTNVLQAGLIQAAVLSVTLTLALFFVFGQITQVDEVTFVADNSLEYHESLRRNPPVASFGQQNNYIQDSFSERPNQSFETVEAPQMVSSREQIVAQMQLPNIQSLLDGMVFEHQTDRQLAESAIALAMNDISFMLNAGDLDTARQRYALLKDTCRVCELPDTLEALAQNYGSMPERG